MDWIIVVAISLPADMIAAGSAADVHREREGETRREST